MAYHPILQAHKRSRGREQRNVLPLLLHIACELEHHIQTGNQIFASDSLAPTCRENDHTINLINFYKQEERSKKRLKYSQRILSAITSRPFCPTNSVWTNCKNYTYRPHSNECGPRTILALAIMISNSTINQDLLLRYMNPIWPSSQECG